ncbi:type II toxin-antitoxin system RelE/ParE family toxin [Curvibacter sp. CHRR-16]|uniref:type II toxin-antitoxin system RelE/ParE family toxin n=1 Tax=Curvibacter sp. CHRR-16 TaxID=2835872 RepID=UPI001BDA1938|nr:type II toxin-antitoxin system RelE/ParE family toxin [Curvibacter sp. CHRR-16]MBT0570959.1 type II toxin-antitoxin system RelE/ParE family toxin [Curvibacter sp. CHRR-16]
MNFKLLPEAQVELDEAYEWYALQAEGLGERFLAELIHTFGLIQQYPTAWHPLSTNTRRCRLKRFPYGVIYAIEAQEIIIIAIAHLHRRPNYWIERTTSEP